MRNVHQSLAFLFVAFGAATTQFIACANTAEDCSLNGECPGPGASGSGSSSGGGQINLSCGASPRDDTSVISNTCGVFVKPAASGGDGSIESPLGGLTEALDKARELQKPYVFACKGTFTGAVVVPAGTRIFGGLDCENAWAITDQHTLLKGADGEIPLVFDGDGSSETRVEFFDAEAANAGTPGGNSIAALARSGTVLHLENCSLTAGTGADGQNGDSASATPPDKPMAGGPGINACANPSTNNGGTAYENACETADPMFPEYSLGGNGGNGYKASGQAGQPGSCEPAPMVPKSEGGKPGLADCNQGGHGVGGANGVDGMPGAGALVVGSLSTTFGWVGAEGGAGGKGKPGEGGGGGGGQKGTNCAGASGGAGGAGGCGGTGGKGGKSGGASIALVSIGATVSLVNVKLASAKGGKGGDGGNSQQGAVGGDGGKGGTNGGNATLYAGCNGGKGGDGGSGGPGGGGTGGHSLGIAFTGAEPSHDTSVSFAVPVDGGGPGGIGGNGNAAGNGGAKGQAAQTLSFN